MPPAAVLPRSVSSLETRTDEATTGPKESWLPASLLALGALSLGRALQINHGMWHPTALVWLSVALGLCAIGVVAFRFRQNRIPQNWGEQLLCAILLGGLLLQLVQQASAPPALRFFPQQVPTLFRAGLAAVAIVAILGVLRVPGTERIWFPLILVIHAALGYWILEGSREAPVDVYFFQRDASRALLQGTNPYTVRYRNIYGPGTPYYSPDVVMDGWLTFGFPYFPFSLLLGLPGHLIAGDFRYSNLAALSITGALIAYVRPGPVAALASCLCLFTPMVFLILELGWTEPLVVLLLAATVFCACRAPRGVPYAYGLLLAVKQYLVLALPVTHLLARAAGLESRKVLVIALVLAASVTMPFLLWEPRPFLESVVTLQLKQPFRADSLSYPAWIATQGGPILPAALAFTAAAAALGLSVWAAPRTAAGTAASLALIYFTFFAFNKQAFANYYFFVIGALCCAVAAVQSTNATDAANRQN